MELAENEENEKKHVMAPDQGYLEFVCLNMEVQGWYGFASLSMLTLTQACKSLIFTLDALTISHADSHHNICKFPG